MFTLRATEGITLLDKVRAALDYLVQQEALIVPPRGTSLKSRFTAQAQATPIAMNGTPPQCKLHGQPMNESRYGGYYCPMPDETTEKGYCTHRVTKAGKYKGG